MILVTGATGFVGSHTAEAVARTGAPIRCTLRKTSDPRWLQDLHCERVTLDLGAPDADYAAAVRGVRAVVHVGGITRAKRPEDYARVNDAGTIKLAEAAAAEGVERFVYLSSLAARGPDGHTGPASPYGASKRAPEKRLRDLEDLDVVVLRPGGVYGPRDTDLLPLFRTAARGWLLAPTGGGKMQPVYVTDVASAAVASLDGNPGFGPWPIAEAGQYDWSEVGAALGEALGRRVRLIRTTPGLFFTAGLIAEVGAALTRTTPELDRRRAIDIARHTWTTPIETSMAALGWRPEVRLPEGLAMTVDWYEDNGLL